MQKIISIIFSSITIIPIYYLIRQFFDKKFAILGVSIFAFEPKIIMNSVIGIADPLYIFLISVSFAIVFNKKFSLVGFVIISIATMVRPEGIFVFGGIFIIYILKNKENKKILLTSILAIIIFISILSPMMIYKNSIHGDDRIFGRISETIDYHTKPRKFYREYIKIDEHTTLVRFHLANNQKITEWITSEDSEDEK